MSLVLLRELVHSTSGITTLICSLWNDDDIFYIIFGIYHEAVGLGLYIRHHRHCQPSSG